MSAGHDHTTSTAPDDPATGSGTPAPATGTSAPAEPDPVATRAADSTATNGAVAEDTWSHFAPTTPPPAGRVRRGARRVGRFLAHEWTLASLGGVATATLMTWPTVLHPTRTIPEDIWDPTLQAWQMAWSGHAMRTDPAHLWSANAFFPDRNSFAFSDTLFGYFPAGMIGTGPVAALVRYNLIFMLVFALAFVGGYALLRQLGSSRTGAVLAGAAVAYAPWRWGQAGHMHVLSTGGIMLSLAMLARGHGYSLRHGRRPDLDRPGWALAGWLVAAWQISLGFGIGLPFAYILGATFLVAGLVMLARRLLAGRRLPFGTAPSGYRLPRRRLLVADGVGMLAFAAVGAFMGQAYLAVAADYPYAKRTVADLMLFSPPLRSFFTAPPESLPWGGLHDAARATLAAPAEMALLPGFTLYALAAAGLFVSAWRLRVRLWLLAGVIASILFGTGTRFFGGRYTYLLLFDHLPGFNSIRTPGRLVVWTTILLAVLAAGAVTGLIDRAFAMTADRVPYRPGALVRLLTLIPVALLVLEGTNQVPHPVVPGQPAAVHTMAGPALVLPTDQLTDENVMLWSTSRFQKIVNGGSGFVPHGQQQTREVAMAFPDATSVEYLRELGVRTVVVLKDRVRGTPYEHAATDDGAGLGITRKDDGEAVVFDLGTR